MNVVGFFFVGVFAEGVDGLAAVELAVVDIFRRAHDGDVQLAVTGADVIPVDEVDAGCDQLRFILDPDRLKTACRFSYVLRAAAASV